MAFNGFDEAASSPKVVIRPFGGSTGTRVGYIAGSNVTAFILNTFPTGLPPAALSSAYPFLRAQSLIIEPAAAATQIASPAFDNLDYDSANNYDLLKCTIEYGVWEFDQAEDPVMLEHRWSIGGDFITLPSGGFEWNPKIGSDNGIVSDDVEPGIMVSHSETQLHWTRVVSPPFVHIRDQLGSVNDRPMAFKTGTVATETNLFLGAELQRTVLGTGASAWDLTYRFSERRVPLNSGETHRVGGSASGAVMTVGGWNHFFRSEKDPDQTDDPPEGQETVLDGRTGFYRLQYKDDGRNGAASPIYRLKNHNLLFQETP